MSSYYLQKLLAITTKPAGVISPLKKSPVSPHIKKEVVHNNSPLTPESRLEKNRNMNNNNNRQDSSLGIEVDKEVHKLSFGVGVGYNDNSDEAYDRQNKSRFPAISDGFKQNGKSDHSRENLNKDRFNISRLSYLPRPPHDPTAIRTPNRKYKSKEKGGDYSFVEGRSSHKPPDLNASYQEEGEGYMEKFNRWFNRKVSPINSLKKG